MENKIHNRTSTTRQAIILAAGLGERMQPLTFATPKPLVNFDGKPLIEHAFDVLPDSVTEVIVIIGYLGEQIKKHLGNNFKGRNIIYISQIEQKGTFNALKLAKPYLHGDFLVLFSDDIFLKEDIEKLTAYNHAILVKQILNQPGKFGHCTIENDLLVGIIEKSLDVINPLAVCGPFKTTGEIFNEPIAYGKNNEEVLSPMIGNMSKRIPINVVYATYWHPIASPEDLINTTK